MSRIADKMIEIQEAIYAQGSVVDIDAVARECGVPVQWVKELVEIVKFEEDV